ncbi:MAG: hypothetical protein ABSB68_01315 [Acidimicrobiales bacterium]
MECFPLPPLPPLPPRTAAAGAVVLVVVVLGDAALGAAPDFGCVVGEVLTALCPGPADVPPAVVVVTTGAGDVVVVTAGAGCCAGGTSVDALQICAYVDVSAGGGSLELSGSSIWNLQPSTSLPGLDTDCSVGPLLA